MGVDGVSKPGSGISQALVEGVGATDGGGVAEDFAVERGETVDPAAGSEALVQLQRGELGIDQYLDVRVGEATRHLEGKLSEQQLDFVRESLRRELATDPVLIQLVRRTTGAIPAE